MTREEAILLLHDMKDRYDEIHENTNYEIGYEQMTALDMAIEALQYRPIPCEKCIHVKSCRKVIILKNRTYKLIKYCSQGAERKGGDGE